MAFDMLRSRPLLGVLVGFSLSSLVCAPGCLRTLDESRIGQSNSSGGAAGSGGGSAGSDASTGGSAGQPDGGGSGGSDGSVDSDGGLDAPVDARPEAGFTPYDKSQHPVVNLLGGAGTRLVAVDKTTVFATTYDDLNANLVSVPIAGGQATTVTTTALSRPQTLVAPQNSISVYYAGASAADVGVIGRFLKNTDGGANPEHTISVSGGFGRAMGMVAASDNNAYVSARATSKGEPVLLKFSLSASTTTAVPLLTADSGGATGGPITMSQGCVYWISNGGVWVVPSSGVATQPAPALEQQVTDAINVTSDSSNIYYTRGTGEVWQRAVSGKCDGSGPAEKYIAWGYTNIGHVGVYGSTVVWGARGDPGNSYQGGGIFTTSVGGYDVVQIAPPDDGVDDIAVGPAEIVYSTLNGYVRKVAR